MTVKPTVSLTDHGYAFAKSLVERGKFASVSAVMQYGLHLVEREEEAHHAHIETIRADLDRRAREPSLPASEFDAGVDAMLSEKRDAWLGRGGG